MVYVLFKILFSKPIELSSFTQINYFSCDQMEELKVAQFIPKDPQKVAKTNFSDILQNSS